MFRSIKRGPNVPVQLVKPSPNDVVFEQAPQVPNFNLSKRIGKPLAPAPPRLAPGVVPLRIYQDGALDFAEPNVEGYKLRSEQPRQNGVRLDAYKEIETPAPPEYEYHLGMRPAAHRMGSAS